MEDGGLSASADEAGDGVALFGGGLGGRGHEDEGVGSEVEIGGVGLLEDGGPDAGEEECVGEGLGVAVCPSHVVSVVSGADDGESSVGADEFDL